MSYLEQNSVSFHIIKTTPSRSQNAVHKTFTGRKMLMQDNIDKLIRLAEQRFERCDKKSGCSALEDAQKLIDSSEFPELLYEQRQNILVLKIQYGCEEV